MTSNEYPEFEQAQQQKVHTPALRVTLVCLICQKEQGSYLTTDLLTIAAGNCKAECMSCNSNNVGYIIQAIIQESLESFL